MQRSENNLNGTNNSNTVQTLTERNAVLFPKFFTTRLAFALQETGLRFFEELLEKHIKLQDILMLTHEFERIEDRKDFMDVKWKLQELAKITQDYNDDEIDNMISEETKVLTKNYLSSIDNR